MAKRIRKSEKDQSEPIKMDAEEMAQFELDFCTALNMMDGKSYREAVEEAKQWVKEVREDEKVI